MKHLLSIEFLQKDGKTRVFEIQDGKNDCGGNLVFLACRQKGNVYSCEAKVSFSPGYVGYAIRNTFVTDVCFEEAEFFAPSAYYGDIHALTKLGFFGGISGSGVDYLSAPILGFYRQGKGTLIRDLTPGRRDTISDDAEVGKCVKTLVSGAFDLPGLGVQDVQGKIALYHQYPAHTYHNIIEGKNLYRFTNRSEVSFSFDIFEKNDSTFDEFCASSWREEFKRAPKIENGVDTHEAIQCVIDHVCAGYGYREGIPQFCTNTDHFLRESGFLFRNTDLAEILLRYKHHSDYRVSLSDEQLIAVMDSQVDNEYAGKNQVWPFSRSRIEGVFSVLRAYLEAKQRGIVKSNWLDFVLREAELVLDDNEYFSIPFLVHLYGYTKDKKYLDAAIRKGDFVWEKKLIHNNFSGGITDFAAGVSLDKETGLLTLSGYIELYEATKDPKYLTYAKKCADYAETYTQLWDINLEPKEYDDTNDYGQLGHGNSHVNAQGLSYVSNTCAVGDPCNLISLIDFAKLSAYSGDPHYSDFARFAYVNSFNVMYLDDKTGGMDDYLYSAGYGFAPEYTALAGSVDGACNGRGKMHDSTIAWVLYSFLLDGFEFEVNHLLDFRGNKKEKRYKIIPVDHLFAYPSKLPVSNLIYGGRRTFFDIGLAGTVELFFKGVAHVDKLVLSYQDPDVCCHYEVISVRGGVLRPMTKHFHAKGFYDVIPLDEDVTSIRLVFEKKKDLYLSGVVPFGLADNKLQEQKAPLSETFSQRYVRDEVSYFVNGDQRIPFAIKPQSYCGDHIEFLRGGLARIHDREAKAVFDLKAKHTLFWLRKCRVEPFLGSVEFSLLIDGKAIASGPIQDTTTYIDTAESGRVELCFKAIDKNSVEFGYLTY